MKGTYFLQKDISKKEETLASELVGGLLRLIKLLRLVDDDDPGDEILEDKDADVIVLVESGLFELLRSFFFVVFVVVEPLESPKVFCPLLSSSKSDK